MDELFSKAIDALDLNEYPTASQGVGGDSLLGSAPRDLGAPRDMLSVPPSALEAARRVLGTWEEIDLEGKKAGWDEAGLAISSNQETSTKNRRSLAEQTKAFKSSAGTPKDFATLLKAYQAEVDSLTKRAKHAETVFLGVYQLLYDAPDVLPILRSFVEVSDRVATAEQEARRLRQELEVAKGDAANVKSLHAQIRRLEDRNVELEERLDEKVAEAVQAKEKELQQSMGMADSREQALLHQMAELRDNVASLQKLHDKAQSALFDCKAKMEEELAAKQNELDSTLEELEACQARVGVLERTYTEAMAEALAASRHASIANGEKERELEPAQAEAVSEAKADSGSPLIKALSQKGALGDAALAALAMSPLGRRLGSTVGLGDPLSLGGSPLRGGPGGGEETGGGVTPREQGEGAKERLVSKLHAELQQLEQSLQAEKEGRVADAEAAQAALEAAAAEVEAREKELEERPTLAQVEDLKRHIRILQAMAGTDAYDEWAEDGPTKGGMKGAGAGSRQGGRREEDEEDSESARIQAALKDSNKRLQAELTAARTLVAEKTLEAEEAAAKVVSLGEHCAELRALVAKLEDDILKGSGSLREILTRGAGSTGEAWAEAGTAGGIEGLLNARDATSAGPPRAPGAIHSASMSVVPFSSEGASVPENAGAGGDADAMHRSGTEGGGSSGFMRRGSRGLSEDDSMLLIVCDQRERFRKRMKELEEENGQLQDSLAKGKMEIQRLTADNLTLYEKIRFLEHYNREFHGGARKQALQYQQQQMLQAQAEPVLQGQGRGAQTAAGKVIEFAGAGVRAAAARYSCFGLVPGGGGGGQLGGPGGGPSHGFGDGASGGISTEMRYRRMYEEKMNPFAEFHAKEEERSYRNLRLHDKITLTSSRFLLSNKYGRTFVFFYTVLLHVFILVILYRATHPRTSLATGVACLPSPAAHAAQPKPLPLLRALPEDEDSSNTPSEDRTFADVVAENMGTFLQATKLSTSSRRLRRLFL